MRQRAFPHAALQRAPHTYLRSGGQRQLAVVGLDGLVEDIVRSNLLLDVGQAGSILPGVQLFLQEHSSRHSQHGCGGLLSRHQLNTAAAAPATFTGPPACCSCTPWF